MANKFIATFFLILTGNSFGAACCGGGAGLPNLITGDFRSQFSFVGSNSAVTHTINNEGKFLERESGNEEVKESFTLKVAHLIEDFWQVGIEVPFVQNTHRVSSLEESSSGIGDLKIQLAYEFLPEYSFSLWKPRGFIFLQQNIINSSSVYESDQQLGTDAISTGLDTTNLGLSFVKIISTYDFTFTGEVHKSSQRKFSTKTGDLTVKPSLGYSYLVGAGFSPKNGNLRYGGSFLYSFEGEKDFEGTLASSSSEKETYEVGLNIGYKLLNNSIIFGYSDQAFLGKGRNINVTKTLSISFINQIDL